MNHKYILAWFLVCFSLTAQGHPLHLTFTNLEFNAQKGRWELTVKVFSDDFATNLKMATGTETVIGKRTNDEQTEALLKIWLESRLKIWFDQKPVEFGTWKFTGLTVKDDASWLKYTFTAPWPGSEIKIKNTLLLDLYTDQKNLFILSMGQFQTAHEFKNKDQETVIKLNK